MCCRVLPMWEGIASPEQAQILTLLAELCMFTAQISNPLMAAENVYKILLVSIIVLYTVWVAMERSSEQVFTLILSIGSIYRNTYHLLQTVEVMKKVKRLMELSHQN